MHAMLANAEEFRSSSAAKHFLTDLECVSDDPGPYLRAVLAVRGVDVHAGDFEVLDRDAVGLDDERAFVVGRVIRAGEIDLRSAADAAHGQVRHVDLTRVRVGCR